MKYAIVYSSRTGNTKGLADAAKERLGDEVCLFGSMEQILPEQIVADLLVVGFWADKGTCDEKMAEFLSSLKHQRIFLFGTAGFGGREGYFLQIMDRVRQNLDATNTVVGTYMCQGKMPETVRKRYEKMLEENLGDPKAKAMIESFDTALQHPDEHDREAFCVSLKEAGSFAAHV